MAAIPKKLEVAGFSEEALEEALKDGQYICFEHRDI
ncbi:MAG: hypothetical protein ACJATW_002631 [Glaciecola sp.]